MFAQLEFSCIYKTCESRREDIYLFFLVRHLVNNLIHNSILYHSYSICPETTNIKIAHLP